MRTVLAPGPDGPGRPIKLLTQACARRGGARVLFARIQPAPAEGAYHAGKVDTQGFPLHLQYSVQCEDAVAHVNYPGVTELDNSKELVVKFGSGTHWLNYPGEVYLTGGVGLWTCDIQVIGVNGFKPHWHKLLRSILPNEPFDLPHAHSMIGTYNGVAHMTMSDDGGATDLLCIVGAVPVPAIGPVTVATTGSLDRSLWVFTQWFG